MIQNLATIQKIKALRPHTNSDNLELATVLGWQVVVKKGEFKVDDLVVYIVVDTVLPERLEFEFLRNKHFRIKPIRLRGEESAGIVFPLSILGAFGYDFRGPVMAGIDVTEVLGIKHYEKPIPAELAGIAHGGLPGFLIMTDEDNLRTYPDAVPEMYGRPFYITRKEDGSSGTFFLRRGEFGVCSRKVHLKESESNGFWRMARKYDIENVLRTAFPDMDVAVQGEVVGPGIQENKLGLKELELRVFNLFEIVSRHYLGFNKLVEITDKYKLPMVPIVHHAVAFGYTLEELIALANEQKYATGGPAEGIVIRPQEGFVSQVLKKYWSGKVLNEKYKEK